MTDVVVIDDDTTQVVEIPTTAPSFVIDGIDGEVLVVSSGSEIVVENGNAEPVVEVMTQTKGDRGDTGPAGAKGNRGDRGVPGPEGLRGRDGPDGPRGFRGPMGQGGGQGSQGPSGPPGAIDSELLLELVQPMLNEAALIPIGQIRDDIAAMPGKVVNDVLGDVAGGDITDMTWAAGEDDAYYVGTVSTLSMISDADYNSLKSTSSLIAKVGNSVGAIRKEQYVMAEANRASAREVNTLLAQVGNNVALLQTQQSATSTLAYSTATSLTELSALTEASLASFSSQITVLSDDVEAISSSLTTYIAENNGNVATITAAVEANADETSALATTVNGLSVSVGTVQGNVTELYELVGTLDGSISSKWQLKTQVVSGDRVVTTGVALGASIGSDDSYKSEIIFMADTVAFLTANDGDLHQPFIFDVANDTAFLNAVFIEDASITNAKIGGVITSDDYEAGVAGWSIDKTGAAEFNSGTFRGALSAATGTFSGVLTAGAINAVGTINIAGNAVSTSSFAAGTSLTITVPTGGADVLLSGFINSGASATGNGYVPTASAYMYVNGGAVVSGYLNSAGVYDSSGGWGIWVNIFGSSSLSYKAFLAAGTHTIAVGASVGIGSAVISALILKR